MLVYIENADLEIELESFIIDQVTIDTQSGNIDLRITITGVNGQEVRTEIKELAIPNGVDSLLNDLHIVAETYLQGVGGRPNDRSTR